MKKAWEIAKKAAIKFNDSARIFFSEALKIAWETIKNSDIVEKLKKIGREWTKGDHHRIYFNSYTQHIDADKHNLSNKQLGILAGRQVYYDVNEKCFYNDVKLTPYFSEIKKGILQAI